MSTEIIHLDQQIVKEILKLAHKLPSPKSVSDTPSDDIGDYNAVKVDELAFAFMKRIVQISVTLMQNAGFHFTICQCFAAHALESFMTLDCIGHVHSYMLDNDDDSKSEGSTADSDWVDEDNDDESEEESMEEDECQEDENDDCDASLSSSSSNDDEDQYFSSTDYTIDDFLPLHMETPKFDSMFVPISKKDISVSNEVFLPYVIRIIHHLKWWGVGDEIPERTIDTFKRAMYAFVIAKLKE